jgi:hypothetical protein
LNLSSSEDDFDEFEDKPVDINIVRKTKTSFKIKKIKMIEIQDENEYEKLEDIKESIKLNSK